MSKPPSKSNKKVKRDDKSDSESSDDDLQPIHFFVPGENINAAVLVEYITQYVDSTAKITSSHHPTDRSRTGFNVLAKKTLNAVSLRDLINDSKDWDLETQSKKFRKDPYRYADSDTARRRARQGASKGGTDRPQRQRREREASLEPAESHRRDRVTSPPSMSNVPAQYSQYPSSQPHDFSRSTGGYYQQPSRPEQGPNTYHTYNIHATSYSANIPVSASQYMQNPYPSSGGYSQIPNPDPSYPPPSYEQSNTGVPPRPRPLPPGHPDPDIFDREDKPRISDTMDHPSSRQGSIAPGEESGRSYSSSQSRRPAAHDEMMRRSGHRS
ncbi:uncharacterized protein Z518_08418 [Rhinocladiella mackenziei CBS 650.93]|uniref:Uncharacterized protein n=1 Tax=Rhinocladiella mackenziei CBS 650.93 TaxID=1442369 RepID=A0A0D2FKM4_9EURO|nr:uncharacterized protein Z518_08418 [Rhinocladiella mackenziei CBS 650.93]KIX02477.1 hypothetical protein Z518_08418 [Rhinocladiella mackenziei CBS 650.93]